MSSPLSFELCTALTRLVQVIDKHSLRCALMRKTAGYMSKTNKRRDKLNIQPDGSAMQARKRKHSRMGSSDFMIYAWVIARDMAKEKGGKPKSYMADAIKKASKNNGGSSKMFMKWSKGKDNRLFVQRYDSDSASLEFYGRAQRILQDNQLGQKPNDYQPNLPIRELIGLPHGDQQAIAEIIMDNLQSYIDTGKLKSVRGN